MSPVHFAPYVPGEAEPWDPQATAAHLLRRAGFGASPEDIDRLAQQDMEARVAGLFDEAEDQEAEFQDTFGRLSGTFANFADPAQLQVWWCYRMLRTRVPLREKLTLFWHGHFPSSYNKVPDLMLLHNQIDTFRARAWGNFPDLLLAVCRDPAMLFYLDGVTNVKEHPNENFARELLELFTLGIGHYTEKDIRAAARAFTGWTCYGAQFIFNTAGHDVGPKEFLGNQGRLDGGDIVDTLIQHPALPAFLARKLLVFFACPNPPADVVAEAAAVFQGVGLNVKEFLTALFRSKFFYSRACRHTRIASPVELVIGTIRTLDLHLPALAAREHVSAMGQELYAPPSVKGWDGERKWITATTWAARLAFAQTVSLLEYLGDLSPRLDLNQLVPEALVHPGMIVDRLAHRLLEDRLDKTRRAELARFLETKDGKPQPEMFRKDKQFREYKIREAVRILLSLPEYQMC